MGVDMKPITKAEKIRRWEDQYGRAKVHMYDPKLYRESLHIMNLAYWKIAEAQR